VNGRTEGNALFLKGKTAILFRGELRVDGITGMDGPIAQLNDFLERFKQPIGFSGVAKTSAIVIHGDKGTGKSFLMDAIARTNWGAVHRIEPSDKLSTIQETFQRAKTIQPSIITIDRFEELIDKDRNNRAAVIRAFCKELDDLTVNGPGQPSETAQVVVLATCLSYPADIPVDLRAPGRFCRSVFLPLQDVDARKAIFKSLHLRIDPITEDETLSRWSERTHAYNGRDLLDLVGRMEELGGLSNRRAGREPDDSEWQPLSDRDFERALKDVRPTAMHDVNLKPPPTHWDDIRGQEQVKRSLRSAVKRLNERPEVLQALGLSPPKGVLLYGPPGCSKTMTARAMATESGLNFFAVKGAELLNQYVGESERAVRNLFQRARGAAPSMIFFDEIDAIASKRSGMGGSSTTTSHSALNVVTTLLTEMDGFEDMKNVLVLAATNRPQALDPALLRPGRFDSLVYVPPPDDAARAAMFEAFLAGKSVADGVGAVDLAKKTDGYSGAEIAGICKQAAVAAYNRQDDNPDGRAVPRMTVEDFEAALQGMPRMITGDMLESYKKWRDGFFNAV
jgi:AAA family ATPase